MLNNFFLISVQITDVIMRYTKLVFTLFLSIQVAMAQNVTERINVALNKMLLESSIKHATVSLFVLNSKTNEVVFDYNSEVGMAPASSQKIITSITAYETLGNDFQFKTTLGYSGLIKNGTLNGNLIISGSGDPTMASWRYATTKDTVILNRWIEAIKQVGITKINGNVLLNSSAFSAQPVPGGWPWEDLGNYYGAGCWGLNWRENQFDLTIVPSKKEGEQSSISSVKPSLPLKFSLINKVKTGKVNTDKEAYFYTAPYSSEGFVYGNIPLHSKPYTITCAMPNPINQLTDALSLSLKNANIRYDKIVNSIELLQSNDTVAKADSIFNTYLSPPLDSINYWFLKKSVNLYGEALLKSIALSQAGEGTIEKGVHFVKQFWQDRGIEKSELHMIDGSGLSPSNRITTNALVTALQYSRNKPWFPSFYYALPLFNNMKLKSGTMGGVKAFAGYHTSKAGTEYTVAMIVNDFDGTSADVTQKMFQVLDELK